MKTLLDKIEELRGKQYKEIEVYFISKGKQAVFNLSQKCPNKFITLGLGGMGSDLSLFVEDKQGRKPNLDLIDLQPSEEYPRLNLILKELIELQVEFNFIMDEGFYPDLGEIEYNPYTGQISR